MSNTAHENLGWSQRYPVCRMGVRIKPDVYDYLSELRPMCMVSAKRLRKSAGRGAVATLGVPKQSYTSGLTPNARASER